MGDDPKKKKLDRKRIALNQKHEVAYIKEIATGVLNAPTFGGRRSNRIAYSGIKIKRLARAFLKLLKKIK